MTTFPENSIIFRKAGGHTHDGAISSLIDVTKYSLFDFIPAVLEVSATARGRYQINNRDVIKNFIVQTIEERVLNPQGIRIRANVITAREVAVGTLTSDNFTANLVMVNNIIKSNNFNGVFFANGVISNSGTTGWAISNTGIAVFSNAILRGNITANSGTVGGWTISTTTISAGSTILYSNGHISVASGSFTGNINGSSISGGSIDINNGTFSVDSAGVLTASEANISGDISGAIISGSSFSGGSIDINNGTFSVNAAGVLTASSANITGNISGSNITGSTVTVGVFDEGAAVGMQLTTSGYIQGSGTGVKIKDFDGSEGTTLFGNSISTGVLNTYQLSASDGINEVNIDPSLNVMMDLSYSSLSNTHAAMRIQRSTSSNQARHMIFAKADGTFVGSIRYKNNDFNTMVFVGDITGTSDLRLKENIEPLENCLEIVNTMNPISFNFKKSPGIYDIGFIAQELYSTLPVAVEPGGDDPQTEPWSILYSKLIPVSISAIQELSNKIDKLEHRLQILEGV